MTGRWPGLKTILFGPGIFNANAAFASYQDFRSHGWRKLGYLTQMDWSYALAVFVRLREEDGPDWTKHLYKNVKSDFEKSYRFLVSVEAQS